MCSDAYASRLQVQTNASNRQPDHDNFLTSQSQRFFYLEFAAKSGYKSLMHAAFFWLQL